MDIRSLEYCATIARLGSFTKAAETLYVAQPALSIAIRKLEDELGVPLFVRQPRRVTPTAEGELLLRRAERVFQELDSLRRELRDVAELKQGEVKIALPPMFGIQFFPQLMVDFRAAYPGLTLTVTEGGADDIRRLLDSGEIDLGMLDARRVPAGWQQVPAVDDEMVLCVSPDHPLAAREWVTAKDLDGLDMVLLDHTFLHRHILDAMCDAAGVRYQVVLQCNLVPLIRRAAASGMGAATLLRSIVLDAPDLRPVPFRPSQPIRLSLCWRDDRYLSKANKAFVDFAVGWSRDRGIVGNG